MALRACTLDKRSTISERLLARDTPAFNSSNLCVDEASPVEVALDVAMAGDGANFTFVTADALAQVSNYMSADCDMKQTFSYGFGSVVGVFSGAAVDNGGTVPFVLAEAIALANNSDTGAPESMFIQRCPQEGTSQHIFGVAINNAGDFDWVQSAVESWSSGVCLNSSSLTSAQTSTVSNITFYEYTHPATNLSTIVPNNLTATVSATLTASSSSIMSLSSETSSSSVSTSTGTTATTPTSTTTAGVVPPGPTQTGIISTCNKYALPDSDQGCWDFAAANGITLDQLCKPR